MRRRTLIVAFLACWLGDCLPLCSQTINAWTNPTSAPWQYGTNWSLGLSPAAGQSILITNQGWKAVGIDPGTTQNFPQTMSVSSISVWADPNSFNLLLLNFSGFQTPLATGVLTISSNGAVTALHATLNVSGAVSIDGALNQGESAIVNAGSIDLGGHASGFNTGFYNMTNGVLQVFGNIVVNGRGIFNQMAGSQTNAGISLAGFDPRLSGVGIASFSLGGGTVSTASIGLNFGTYSQSGGTNQVTGDVTLSSANELSTVDLDGGLLSDLNTTLAFNTGLFLQHGGTHIVSNVLRIVQMGSGTGYFLYGGQLTAQNIELIAGGAFHHIGGTVTNPALLTLGGQGSTWDEQTGGQQFGQLLLGSFASTLSLPGGACVMGFAKSSSVTWSNQAMLLIEHWNGSRLGGGTHQIFFGTNAAGLTPQQVSQIQFHNPGGTTGLFPATILSTGEIVPASILALRRITNGLVIEWGNGATLQTATNVAGPYQDVVGATSPDTNQFTDPQRYFRLKN